MRNFATLAAVEAAVDLAARAAKERVGSVARASTPEDRVVPAQDVVAAEDKSKRVTESVEIDGVKVTVTITVAKDA